MFTMLPFSLAGFAVRLAPLHEAREDFRRDVLAGVGDLDFKGVIY